MTQPPVLDVPVLDRLGESIGDREALCCYLRRYADMLDGRVQRLHAAALSRDVDELKDAVLSLQSSSQMTGARALTTLVTDVRQALLPASLSQACWPTLAWITTAMRDLRRTALATRVLLNEFLDQLVAGADARPAPRAVTPVD